MLLNNISNCFCIINKPDSLNKKKSYILFRDKISFELLYLLFDNFVIDNDLLVKP